MSTCVTRAIPREKATEWSTRDPDALFTTLGLLGLHGLPRIIEKRKAKEESAPVVQNNQACASPEAREHRDREREEIFVRDNAMPCLGCVFLQNSGKTRTSKAIATRLCDRSQSMTTVSWHHLRPRWSQRVAWRQKPYSTRSIRCCARPNRRRENAITVTSLNPSTVHRRSIIRFFQYSPSSKLPTPVDNSRTCYGTQCRWNNDVRRR